MIGSKKDLKEYLFQDKIALGITYKRPKRFGDEIWRFQIVLRKLEYYTNIRKTPLKKVLLLYYRYRYKKQSVRLGFSISLNVFDKGLSIAHRGTLVVGSGARIGKNCRIHEGVCIGATNGSDQYATIGDNCFIATGVKIIGDVTIGDNVAIGANAVVVKSVEENDVTLGGVPAKIISRNNSFSNLNPLLKSFHLL